MALGSAVLKGCIAAFAKYLLGRLCYLAHREEPRIGKTARKGDDAGVLGYLQYLSDERLVSYPPPEGSGLASWLYRGFCHCSASMSRICDHSHEKFTGINGLSTDGM